MKLGFDLKTEQTQNLVMTPELIQAIKILQFNTEELEKYVQDQVLANPVLETGIAYSSDADSAASETEDGFSSASEEFESQSSERTSASGRDSSSWEEGFAGGSDDFDWYEKLSEKDYYDDISYRQREFLPEEQSRENSYEGFVTNSITLAEHLQFQLQLVRMDAGQRKAAKFIIEALDDNGYLTLSAEEVAEATGVSAGKVKAALEVIQGFDPAGVGARSLEECLIIQLGNSGLLSDDIREVIENHLGELAENRLNVIAKAISASTKKVQEIYDIIRTLEPKPGRQFASQTETRYITPDVIVEKTNGEYVVTLNESSVPRLSISPYYEKLMKSGDIDEKLSKYLSGRMNRALWLIRSIEQRKKTILSVVTAVVKYQQEFFDKGEKYLKILTLRKIAEETGVHESTVSRSINGKYMQSPRGMFEIRYFFSAGVRSSKGEGISSSSIKTIIKELIDGEDSSSPYSDLDIARLLEGKGFEISRRTVAKYRDELNIMSSSKRRRY
ncbi:MAG: RNA polymerase factor sigma-54 [Clostridia bacterium]|nr:RNA polymerase factor sigma-54 [Clostridia bacterium]